MKLPHNPTPHVTKPPVPKEKKQPNKPFTPQSPFTPVNNFVRGILGQNTEKDNQGSKKSWLI